MRQTQNRQILYYMKKGYSLTAMGALKLFGCMRLSSRVNDLKGQGRKLVSRLRVDPVTRKRYSEYWLDKS